LESSSLSAAWKGLVRNGHLFLLLLEHSNTPRVLVLLSTGEKNNTRSSRFPKVAASDDLRERSRKAQGKKGRGKGEEDAGSHTGRRTERRQRAAKDASSRQLEPLRCSGPSRRF
jgi:hypothetical protein